MRPHVVSGEQVDQFRVEELVTSTPVASIFRAIDLRREQIVLIKFPNPDIETDPVLSDRFKREEEIGSSLSHPGLLKVVTPMAIAVRTLSASGLMDSNCGR